MARTTLTLQLQRLAQERWSQRALRTVLRSAWLAICCWCVGVGLSLVLGIAPDLPLIGALALVVLAIGLIGLLRQRRLTALDVARRLDRRFRLQEQLSTAVELAGTRPASESIAALLLGQASQTFRQVRQRIVQRQRAPWSDLIALLAFALVASGLVLFLGMSRSQVLAEPVPLPPLVAAESSPSPEQLAQPTAVAQAVAGAGDQPGTAPGDTGDAAAGQAGMPAGNAPGQAGRGAAPQPGAGTQQRQQRQLSAEQRNAMDAVADALRDQGSTRPAAEALDRGDLAAAAQQLRELADQASQLSEEARQQLADSLRRAAAKVQPSDPDLAQQLRDSARGLERGQDRAAQALEDLARAIEQQGQPGGQAGLPGDPSQQQGAGDQPGSSGGAGNSGAGERRPVENPTRLGVDGKPLPLDVQGEGSTSAPPPEQATAGNLSAVGTAAGGGSGGDGSSGPDPLRVPMDERDVVQDYFSR